MQRNIICPPLRELMLMALNQNIMLWHSKDHLTAYMILSLVLRRVNTAWLRTSELPFREDGSVIGIIG
jgi:hypothetical protein